MSLSAIASQLYTIQTKQRVPLRTAFKLMVREDLAMRFSVYNLVRIVTKSDFLATVAQAATGTRTPLQKKQDEAEARKELADKRFKQFTANSIASLTRKVNLLAEISERNTALINGLYSEIGSFRMQRRMNVNAFNGRAVQVPGRSKTIKSQIDQINERLKQLEVKPRSPGQRGVTAKKKTPKEQQKKDETSFINSFISTLTDNPALMLLLATRGGRAIGLGTLAVQAYALYNAPGAIGRTMTRAQGGAAYEDPITEAVSQSVDPYIAGLGTYTAFRTTQKIMSFIKKRKMAGIPINAAAGRMALINKFIEKYQAKGMDYKSAQKKAGRTASRYIKVTTALKKVQEVVPLIRGLAKRFPALGLAGTVLNASQMINLANQRNQGLISQSKFREGMIDNYDDLLETVGPMGVGALMGGLAGTALFPGVGSLAGAGLGVTLGGLYSFANLIYEFFSGEDINNSRDVATKIYEIIHEDRPHKPKLETTDLPEEREPPGRSRGGRGVERGSTDQSTSGIETKGGPRTRGGKRGPLSVRNNNPGNLRFYASLNKPGYVLENALPAPEGSYAIFPTPELGLEAMRKQVTLDTQKRKLTLQDFISKYAPTQDNNNTANYINVVSQETGIKPNELIPADRIRQVMYYMIKMEGGQAALDYYKPYLRVDLNARETTTAVTAVPDTGTAPPAVVAASNVRAEMPPEQPLVAANQTNAAEDALEETKIQAAAALSAASGIKQQLNAVAQEAGKRINTLEKLNPIENASVHHNDPTLSAFRMNA